MMETPASDVTQVVRKGLSVRHRFTSSVGLIKKPLGLRNHKKLLDHFQFLNNVPNSIMTNKEKIGNAPNKKIASPNELRKTKKLSISSPYDFRHVDHVGFESNELSKTGIVADEVLKFKEVSSQPQLKTLRGLRFALLDSHLVELALPYRMVTQAASIGGKIQKEDRRSKNATSKLPNTMLSDDVKASEMSPHPIAPVRRSRKLKKSDISKPYDFRHVYHAGFESSDVVKACPVAEEKSKLEEITSHQKKDGTQNSGVFAPKHVRQGSSRNDASERSKSSDANAARSSKNSSFKRSASAQNGDKDVKHLAKQASFEEKFPSVKATSALFSKENTAMGAAHSVSTPITTKQMEESSNQKNKATTPPLVRQISTDDTGDSDGKVRKLQDTFIQRAHSEKVRNSAQKAPLSPPANKQQPQPLSVKLEASNKEHVVSGPSSSNSYGSYTLPTLPAATDDGKLPPWMAELGKKERTRLIATVLLAERAKMKDRNIDIGAAKNDKAVVSQRIPKRQAPPPPSFAKVDKLGDNSQRDQGDIRSTTTVKNNELVKSLNEKTDSTDASPPVPKPRRKKQQQQGYVENIGIPTPLLGTPEMIKKRLLISDARQSESTHGPKELKPNEKEKKKEAVEQQAKNSKENKSCSEENTDSDDDNATIRL